MSKIVRIKCQSCRKSFHRDQNKLELFDEPPTPAYYKIKCPLCGFDNKIDVIQPHQGGRAALYEVGMVFYYTISFLTFLGTTPQGMLSGLLLFVSLLLVFTKGILGALALMVFLAVTVFLFSMWMKGDVNANDFT